MKICNNKKMVLNSDFRYTTKKHLLWLCQQKLFVSTSLTFVTLSGASLWIPVFLSRPKHHWNPTFPYVLETWRNCRAESRRVCLGSELNNRGIHQAEHLVRIQFFSQSYFCCICCITFLRTRSNLSIKFTNDDPAVVKSFRLINVNNRLRHWRCLSWIFLRSEQLSTLTTQLSYPL